VHGANRLIPALLKAYGLESKLAEHRLILAWPQVVGPQIAAHAAPIEIRGKTLRVVVDSSPWLHELTLLKPLLLGKLARHAEGALVQDVRFVIGELPARSSTAAADPTPHRTLSEEEVAQVDAAVNALTDPAIRESARRLFVLGLGGAPVP
jgi:hypothetical protein